MLIIKIPTLNDRMYDFRNIYKIYKACDTLEEVIKIDFSGCSFLRQNAVAFLAGLIHQLKIRKKIVVLDFKSCQPNVLRNLQLNGFTKHFGSAHQGTGKNAIPFRHFTDSNEEEIIVDYLLTDWLSRGWVNISSDLAGAIVGNLWEIFANSFEHSRSSTGIMVCGQHYPNKHELALSVVDFGIGIPSKIRLHLNNMLLDGSETLRWAVQRGNSTRQGRPGGLGLDMLKDFIHLNGGEMAVYSGDGYFRWFGKNDEFGVMASHFHGTIVNLTLRCDGRFYKLG